MELPFRRIHGFTYRRRQSVDPAAARRLLPAEAHIVPATSKPQALTRYA
jgi:hypothetical protein